MHAHLLSKSLTLATLLTKEQLKEPVALLWVVVSPGVVFYLLSYSRGFTYSASSDYLSSTSWFYAYVASSVALFGFAFYIVGRRESGFVRSFIYTPRTKKIFMLGQFIACSFMSLMYCAVFYAITHIVFGPASFIEFCIVLARFYVCFVLFSSLALLLTLIPLSFQNTNTLFSIVSFAMLVVGVAGANSSLPLATVVSFFNPLWWANRVMADGVAQMGVLVALIVVLYITVFLISVRYLLVTPVWSRY
ncbi:ABC transporter permease [Pseudomonas gessardii]|uniref:ABC transporter permease n=1 Tax=Pseudomonas gessardii TaxID=78544 RepID=UPI0018D74675|nr:ABC transporter permease [Pseudomonas gessardii]MBH3423320.1 ABC transporter permease [Pseudomonas gessardii]